LDAFLIHNGLKEEDIQSSFIFNVALQYAMSNIQVNQEELDLNGTHQFLVYTDDINTLHENTDTITKTQRLCYGLAERWHRSKDR
jgi:dimeric dUTPase (all-alpha-NTP-PPase superfamily)